MSKYRIEYTDMVSEDWTVWAQTDIIPVIGELVSLPAGEKGRVLFIEHVYEKNRDEFIVLSHIRIILDWNV